LVTKEQEKTATSMGPREFTATITATEPIMGDSSILTFTAPGTMAELVRAGHFVDILCRLSNSSDPLIRRPYSIYEANPNQGTISVLVRPFGRGSAWLCDRQVGSTLDVLGPLGNTFTVAPKSTNLLMVAGGVGAAPLVLLAEESVAKGLNVTYLMGAADDSGLLPVSALSGQVEYVVATDDGSRGHAGFVTELVPQYARWADQVFVCGPEPMFRSLRNTLGPHRIGGKPKVQMSIERTMACGLGACLGCVVETKQGMQTSCIQGPVYDMDDLVW
jgi:dihydroorotate dehydrogenase electron transfer subunit